MNVKTRVNKCRLIERMVGQKEYCGKLGITDISRYHGCTLKPDAGGAESETERTAFPGEIKEDQI